MLVNSNISGNKADPVRLRGNGDVWSGM